jgi:hypothetical protein
VTHDLVNRRLKLSGCDDSEARGSVVVREDRRCAVRHHVSHLWRPDQPDRGGRGALAPNQAQAGFAGVLFGVGAIVILPIFYGVIGCLGSALMAGLYNVVASAIGGVEIDVQ